MKKTMVFTGIIGFLVCISACAAEKKAAGPKEATQQKWVADVNNSKITLEEFNEKWDSIPEQYRGQYGFGGSEGKVKFLDALIKNKLVYLEGLKRGLDKKDEVKKKFEDLKEQLIAEEVLRAELDTLEPSEAEIRKFYDENKQDFRVPESVRTRHILVKSEETANIIIAKLKSGTDFEKLAKEYSEDPGTKEKGGDLGFLSRGQTVPEFENAAFSLKKGEYTTKPVKTDFGYHVIKLEEKKAEGVKPLEEVMEMAKSRALQNKQKAFMEKFLDDLYSKASVKKNPELLGN